MADHVDDEVESVINTQRQKGFDIDPSGVSKELYFRTTLIV